MNSSENYVSNRTPSPIDNSSLKGTESNKMKNSSNFKKKVKINENNNEYNMLGDKREK